MRLVNQLMNMILLMLILMLATGATANAMDLPQRGSAIPPTTNGVPHVQLGVDVDPGIYAELLLRVSNIPDVEIRDTIISLPGAKGFWINERVKLVRPEIIIRGREFAHVHPDGSLHASLPNDLAIAAVDAGWAIPHPWADQRPGWEGFVMIYTPFSMDELDIVIQLVRDSYDFIVGND